MSKVRPQRGRINSSKISYINISSRWDVKPETINDNKRF